MRLGRYARQAAPVRLASSKSSALALIALSSLGLVAVNRVLTGEGVASLWGNPFNLVALGAITWTALGPGAGAAFLQSKVCLEDMPASLYRSAGVFNCASQVTPTNPQIISLMALSYRELSQTCHVISSLQHLQ